MDSLKAILCLTLISFLVSCKQNDMGIESSGNRQIYIPNKTDSIQKQNERVIESRGMRQIYIPNETDSIQKQISNIKYLTLEHKNRFPIGSVDKVIVNDTIMYIYDETTESVFIYGVSGKFINVIASHGRGPKEFLYALDINIYNNKLYLLADRSKIYIYNLKGEFENEISIDGFYCNRFQLSKDGIYVISDYSKNLTGDYSVRLISYDGSIINEYLPFPEEFGVISRGLINQSSFINDSVSIVLPYGNKVYKFGDKKITSTFEMESEYTFLSADYIKKKGITDQIQLFYDTKLFDLLNYQESNDFVVMQYKVENRMFTIFFDKRTGIVTNIDNLKLGIKGHLNILTDIVGITDSCIISTIPTHILVNLEKYMDKESYSGLNGILPNVNIFSNPVLTFYYFVSN